MELAGRRPLAQQAVKVIMKRIVIAFGLFLLTLGFYRLLTTQNQQFVSVSPKSDSVPAQTTIQASITKKVPKAARAGQTITAVVTAPVVVDGNTVIPPGARFEGNLQALSVHGRSGEATIDFTALRLDGRALPLQARPVTATLPVKSDTEILTDALRAIMGAGLGAALGAASGDPNMVTRGMREGTTSSTLPEVVVPITVVLLSDLKLSESQLPS